MRILWLGGSQLSDEEISVIAKCVDKIEELWLKAGDITLRGWKILLNSIDNRQTPVS